MTLARLTTASRSPLTRGLALVLGLGGVAVLTLCVVTGQLNSYLVHILILAMVWGIFAAGWNLAAGFAGMKAFGHQGFFAIGAYGSAMLSMQAGLSPWATLWIGAALAALISLLVVTPVLRLRSTPQIAIVTLAFGEITRIVIENSREHTGGEMGLLGIPALPDLGPLTFGQIDKTGYFLVALALLALTLALTGAVMFSRHGMAMKAIRDAPEAAESLGLNGTAYRVAIFAFSAFITGYAGAFFAHYLLILTPLDAAGLPLMIMIVSMTIVGGYGSFLGPVVGAVLLTWGSESFRAIYEYQLLIYGALVILAVRLAPGGLVRLLSARKTG